MTDWTEKLSDYLDGDLSGDERAGLEAALQGDAELRRVVEELRAVKNTAASLPQHAPQSDLWSGIEARIEADRHVDVVPLSSAVAFPSPSRSSRPRPLRSSCWAVPACGWR